jgi:DNA-binding IclR family transcriptional regulator
MTENVFDASLVGKALAARLDEIEATIERVRTFAFEPDRPASSAAVAEGDALDNARELVLRALRMISDPLNSRMLLRLLEGDTDLDALATLLGLPRLSVWERVNDLVQAGLVARSLEADQAGLTAAGEALVELVETIVRAAGEGQ